jgi:DNA-binding transcriptional LysR family regulator
MLEMKRLRLLWELSSRGTVTAVAEALNYSPSAVSQQLALLEREAEVPLLRRSGRTLELTPAAEALVAETEELLAGLERAEAALHRGHDEVGGVVRLAVFQTALLALMPQTLRRLRAEHPALRVEMVQYEPEAALRETWGRGFDLVIAEQYPGHATAHFAGLDREPLLRDAISLALPPRDADPAFDAVNRLEDAAELPWAMEQRGAASRHWAEQACRSAGFEPDVRYETADLQAHVKLIESGNAVALLPGLVHVSDEHRLRLVPLAGHPFRTVMTAARISAAGNPALQAVRSALVHEADALGRPPA